jgi:tetratricopeptide (TPR) repeat protein/transcriptional regulator with XRE-family HTH domain
VNARSRASESSFAARLRALRTAAQLTQEELSERSGVSVRAISDLERGVKTRPQRATVQLLAEGLGLTDEERSDLQDTVTYLRRPGAAVPVTDLPVGGFLGSVPDTPLVAREREIERLRTAVDSVANGAGRFILLSGEPGVGKTRLAQEITVICRARHIPFIAGRCYQPLQTVAYYPLLEVIEQLVTLAHGRLTPDPLQRWPQLRTLLPDGSAQDPATGDRAGDQLRLIWAVAGLIEELASFVPIAIAIDDLQWADQASLELLQHLARQLRQVPVLLVGTYRDGELGRRHPLRSIRNDLRREHLADEMSVERLDTAGTAALAASTLAGSRISPDFADLVFRHTQGNAFYVQEIVRALNARGDVDERDGVWNCRTDDLLTIPRTVQEAVGERLSRLSLRAQGALQQASVLGQTFHFDEMHAMGELTEDELDEILGEAVDASILEAGWNESYTFYHALTQRVLYQDIAPRKRRRLHLAAGIALEQQPRSIRDQRVAELAWHFREAGDLERALQYSVLAGDQSERRFAHREAEQHYRAALNLSRSAPNTGVEAPALEKLGRVLTNLGRYAEAHDALERAGRFFRELGDQEGEARVTVQLAPVQRAIGSPDEGIARIQSVLQRAESHLRPRDTAELYIVLDLLLYSTGRYQEALDAAQRGSAFAQEAGELAAFARAETGRGTELLMLGRIDEALAALEAAIALPEAAADPYNLVRAMYNAGEGYSAQGDVPRGRRLVEQSVDVAERIDSPLDRALGLMRLGVIDLLMGNGDMARTNLRQGEQMIRALPPTSWMFLALLDLGWFHFSEGNWAKATELTLEALSEARQGRHFEGVRAAERLLAEIDVLEGRPGAAIQRLESLLDRPGLEELHVTQFLPTLAAAYAESGDAAQAEHTLVEAIRRANASNQLPVLAGALMVRGRLRAGEERWAEAEADFAETVRLARGMPDLRLEGHGLFEWGTMLAKRGERSGARERLNAALAVFERLGAERSIERANEALAGLQQ